MTDQTPENTQLFLTAAMPCPYLPGRQERKLFTHLTGRRAAALHHLLSDNGFRRSQNLIYRPGLRGLRRVPVGPHRCRASSSIVGALSPHPQAQ